MVLCVCVPRSDSRSLYYKMNIPVGFFNIFSGFNLVYFTRYSLVATFVVQFVHFSAVMYAGGRVHVLDHATWRQIKQPIYVTDKCSSQPPK